MSRFLRTPFFIIIVVFFLFGYFALFYVDSAHDGIVLRPTLDVLSGKMLFSQTFNQYGALFIITHAAMMKLLGEHVYVLRFTTLLFYSATAAVLWVIYRRYMPFKWNVIWLLLWVSLAPLFAWYFHSWSSVQAAFFQSLSILFYLYFIRTQKIYYLFFVGLSTVVTFWCRQPVGILNTVAVFSIMGVFIWRRIFSRQLLLRGFYSLVAGIIVGIIPILVWLGIHGALRDWWLQSIVMLVPFAQQTRGISINQFARSLGISRYWKDIFSYWIWIAIPGTAVVVFIYAYFKRNADLLVITIIGLFSWHQYYPATERGHFFWAMIPLIPLFIWTIYKITQTLLYNYRSQIYISIVFAVTANLILSITTGLDRIHNAQYVTAVIPYIAGVPITKQEKEFYENISATLHAYFSMYPNLTYINDSNNSFYPLFNPDHFHSFHGIFVNWGALTSTIYPSYVADIHRYVQEYRPLIFTRYPDEYPDYCDMNIIAPEDPPIKLLVPQEIGKDLQNIWTHNFPELRPFTCLY